jgi:phosphate transport system substrate-binding protein
MELRRHAVFGTALLSGVALLVSACGSSTSPTSGGATSAAANLTCSTAPVQYSAPAPSGAAGATSAAPIPTGTPSAAVTLTEDGSSLIYPYMLALAPQFNKAYPKITLSPASGGSGKGIQDASAGNVNLGGSDAYLSSTQSSQFPGLLNIPIAVSAQAINYNVPGLTLPSGQTGLHLSGCIIANIYEGNITNWNDPSIAALNPGATLPSLPIVPVHRVDSSGDTFIFTSFLSATNSAWSSGPSFGTTVSWPSASQVTGNGNPAMVQACSANPGCIAYIGVSVELQAQSAGLGEALLQNQSGNYVLPSGQNMAASVAAGASTIPANLAEPIIYEKGANSYPIVNFEYLMVDKTQKSADLVTAIQDFFAWATSSTGGATPANLGTVGFIALPSNALAPVEAAVDSISAS